MIRRGTGPTLGFTTPYEQELVDRGYITFQQNGVNVLDIPFDGDQVEIEDNMIYCTLTQSQTLVFDSKVNLKIQIRAVLTSGVPVASQEISTTVGSILKDGVI